MANQTAVREFVFLGFSHFPEPHALFFVLFLTMYVTTLFGNGLILATAFLDSSFHTPMYYFIRHLSFLDMCYTSVTLPHVLKNLLAESKTISFQGCLVQLYFLVAFVGVECLLLAVMAYDRYVAICHPLTYTLLMNRTLCAQLVGASWTCGLLNSVLHTAMTCLVPFCASHNLDHVFCDVPQLLKLSCADTFLNQITLVVVTMLLGVSPFLCIMVSYIHIVSAVLRIRTSQGRRKAFSTCASHLTVVTLFFSSGMFNYNRPGSSYPAYLDTLASVLYNVVTPMLNPIIYCLRNKEMKEAVKRVLNPPQMPSL
ncbi:LOW QUALITY PROTEIN: olfactory receptor 5V1-like [Sphaerodactylus townsendi]|uniref:LOW QUALITY PROTEIN: olfactory receptor 5V1-like n=1 Tax=Sphaerodactylus townsendi TaxID=933632 RepID=UPI00202656E8|nr:LOW QUALITY PROTEIN: olfactory receptor 5V1-like [Sphaerodactylus townsendi]